MQWGCAWLSRGMWALPAPQSSCSDSGLSLWPGLVAKSQVQMTSCSWGRGLGQWLWSDNCSLQSLCSIQLVEARISNLLATADFYSFTYTIRVRKSTQGPRLGAGRVCTMKHCLQTCLYQETFMFAGTAFWCLMLLWPFLAWKSLEAWTMEASWDVMIFGSFCYLDCSHRSESYFRVSSKLNSSRTIMKVSNLPWGLTLVSHSVDTASFTFPQPMRFALLLRPFCRWENCGSDRLHYFLRSSNWWWHHW